jgi:hypothetical protein
MRIRILIFIWCGCGSTCGSRLPKDSDPCGSGCGSGSTTLTETEVSGDSKRTIDRGPSLVVRWTRRVRTIDFCSALASLVGPVQNVISSPYTFSLLLDLIAQQPGQLGVLGRLSLCLWSYVTTLSPIFKCNGILLIKWDEDKMRPVQSNYTFSLKFKEKFWNSLLHSKNDETYQRCLCLLVHFLGHIV